MKYIISSINCTLVMENCFLSLISFVFAHGAYSTSYLYIDKRGVTFTMKYLDFFKQFRKSVQCVVDL